MDFTVMKSLQEKVGGPILVVVLTLLAFAVGWGRNAEKISELSRQVSIIEQQTITRNEYNDLKDRLDRIENKVDDLRAHNGRDSFSNGRRGREDKSGIRPGTHNFSDSISNQGRDNTRGPAAGHGN